MHWDSATIAAVTPSMRCKCHLVLFLGSLSLSARHRGTSNATLLALRQRSPPAALLAATCRGPSPASDCNRLAAVHLAATYYGRYNLSMRR